jgi:outer membrane autotransporter protein
MQHLGAHARRCAMAVGVALGALPGLAAAQSFSQLFPGTGLTTLPGMTDAQSKMASSIDNVCPTINTVRPGSDLANACNLMTGTALAVQGQANPGLPVIPGITTVDQLRAALTQFNGGAETVVPTSQASVLRNLQGNAVAARLSVLHTRMLGGFASNDLPPNTMLAQADGFSAKDTPGYLLAQNAPTEMSLWHDKLGIFVNVLGQFGSSDSTTSQNGYDFFNTGFVAGADYRLMPQLTVGVSLGYTYSDTSFDSSPSSPPGQFLHGNMIEGSLYASWYPTDQLYIDTVASIGGGFNDLQRSITVPITPGARTATGSFGSHTYGLAVGGGYAMPFDALTLTPTARFELRRVESDPFTESGASGLDLAYGSSQENAVLTFLGGQAQYAISTSYGVVTPTGRFEWAHQYNRGNTAISVSYASDPTGLSTFTMLGDQASRNYYDIGVGVALQLANNWSGFVNYDAILGVSHTSFNSFTAGFRFSF